jgi:hypothetical protein
MKKFTMILICSIVMFLITNCKKDVCYFCVILKVTDEIITDTYGKPMHRGVKSEINETLCDYSKAQIDKYMQIHTWGNFPCSYNSETAICYSR